MVSTNLKDSVGKKTSLQEIKTQANQCEHRSQSNLSAHGEFGSRRQQECVLAGHAQWPFGSWQPRKGSGVAAGALLGDFQLQTLLQTCCMNVGAHLRS